MYVTLNNAALFIVTEVLADTFAAVSEHRVLFQEFGVRGRGTEVA